jgi:hypothetical protein
MTPLLPERYPANAPAIESRQNLCHRTKGEHLREMIVRKTSMFCLLLAIVSSATVADAERYDFRRTKPFMKSFEQSFGNLRGRYTSGYGLVSWQVSEAMGLPNDDVTLPDGNILVSGCRPHSCDEMAAVIADPNGTMLAAGLVHYPCIFVPPPKYPAKRSCDEGARLTIFVKRGKDRQVYSDQLVGWAKRQLGKLRSPPTRLSSIQKKVLS